MMSVSPTQMQ